MYVRLKTNRSGSPTVVVVEKTDKLRKPGYSKDGKHSNPQIVLGLLVSGDGCPLAYSIHEGSKYEGLQFMEIIQV